MILLNLHEFKDYSKTAIYEFLKVGNERSFMVSIRKTIAEAEHDTDNMMLAIEYGLAA
ncbi:MAG: hypothetical protein ABI402_04940 [Ferruginibacter sp.]